jgi:predicted nicotinamide N-methyase
MLVPKVPRLHGQQANGLEAQASVAQLVWGEPVLHLQPSYDLVLASDVLYEAQHIPALLESIRALSSPATRILLAYEERPPVTGLARRALLDHGFRVTQVCGSHR